MEPMMEPKIAKIVCRTCLIDDDLVEVFSDTGLELSLILKLKEHLKLEIEDSDIYTAMCYKCVDLLNGFDQMFTVVHTTQEYFPRALEGKTIIETDEDYKDYHSRDEKYSIDIKYETVEVVEEQEDAKEEAVVFEEMADEDLIDHDEETVETFEEVVEEEVLGSPEAIMAKDKCRRGGHAKSPNSPRKATVKRSNNKTHEEVELRAQEDEIIRSAIVLRCNECSHEPSTFDNLRDHYRDCHNIVGFVNCCGRIFKRRAKLVDHIKVHLDPNAFQCPKCQRTFGESRLLKNHMESHVPHEERQFSCEKCPKRFATKARLLIHVDCHNEDYSFKCDQCDKSFNRKLNLDGHIRYCHNPTRHFVCEVCAREFKSRETLEIHQASHLDTPQPKLVCETCGNKFKNRMTLRAHILQHHKRADERHLCKICNKEFKAKKWFTRHQKMVHGAPQFKCTECNKAFKWPTGLKEHMSTHTGEYLYKCKYCPREFKSNANKYSHQKAQHPVEWEEEARKKKEG